MHFLQNLLSYQLPIQKFVEGTGGITPPATGIFLLMTGADLLLMTGANLLLQDD